MSPKVSHMNLSINGIQMILIGGIITARLTLHA